MLVHKNLSLKGRFPAGTSPHHTFLADVKHHKKNVHAALPVLRRAQKYNFGWIQDRNFSQFLFPLDIPSTVDIVLLIVHITLNSSQYFMQKSKKT